MGVWGLPRHRGRQWPTTSEAPWPGKLEEGSPWLFVLLLLLFYVCF